MPIRAFIENLRSGDIGEIYWANFSMQVSARLLDMAHSRKIFKDAANNIAYQKNIELIKKTGRGSLSYAALQALIAVTSDNKNAINNCGPDGAVDGLPQYCSNVISGRTFYLYCLSDMAQKAVEKIYVDIISKDPKPIGVIPENYIARIFEEGYDSLDKIKNAFPEVGGFLVPEINVRTLYERFWLGSDPLDNAGDAVQIRNRLALGFPEGEFLVRLSFGREKLLSALSASDLSLPRRPSAFCVNDTNYPRFRGRRAEETPESATHLSSGQTVHLTGNVVPSDGLSEWICEAVTLSSSDVRVELLGRIKGAAMLPDHKQFASYLNDHRGASDALDQSIIDELAA